MEIKEYKPEYFDDVFALVHKTIDAVCPKFYLQSGIDAYREYHSKEKMRQQLLNERALVLVEAGKIIGTGTLFENEIKRFFISPEEQGKGYGKTLLKELENNVDKDKYSKLHLYALLGSFDFYRNSGYQYKEYYAKKQHDGNFWCYFEMEKSVGKL